MSAIRPHKTKTDNGPWNGPRNEANLRSGESESYYKKAYAWQDPEGDPKTKAAYKFIHHFVSADGEIGAASTRACSAGIAVLNGGRGGADIPAADRRGVYNHLAGHLRDADMEPPELKSQRSSEQPEIERRFYRAELRLQEDGDQVKIIGYGSLFNTLSEDMGGWQEIVEPGAFGEVLEDDIRSLFNHDFNLILGRTAAGTLLVKEDDLGLRYEITPDPEISYVRDLLASIKRGDVDQSSIGFQVKEAKWDTQRAIPLRRIIKFGRLFDVGPVTIPAFPATSVAVRDYLSALQEDNFPGQAAGFEAAGDPARRLDLMRRRLELVSKQ